MYRSSIERCNEFSKAEKIICNIIAFYGIVIKMLRYLLSTVNEHFVQCEFVDKYSAFGFIENLDSSYHFPTIIINVAIPESLSNLFTFASLRSRTNFMAVLETDNYSTNNRY